MRRIDPAALEKLSAAQREQVRTISAEIEQQYQRNPLLKYRPHPKQVEFHESTAHFKCFLGGNRSGKTTAGILDDVIQAVDAGCLPAALLAYKKFGPPFHCRIITPGADVLEGVVFQKLREWCPREQLVGDSFDKAYSKSRKLLHFKNGSYFDFLTYGQDLDMFSGAAKHRIHYDEEPPKDIRQEGKMRLLDYKGADEIFTMTPIVGMSSWMFDEIWTPWQKGELRNGIVVLVDMDDNPYLDAEQKQIAIAGYSKEELEARKKGRFVSFSGMIYGEFQPARHIIQEREIPRNVEIYIGIDPGIRHMAAVVWAYVTESDTMVIFDELALQGHTIAQVCKAIDGVNRKHGTILANWTVIDPAARNVSHQTGRSDQMEYMDHGVITILGQNAVTAGINRVKERLEADKLFIMDNCQTLIDEFRKYRWVTQTRSENDSKEQPVKADDHLLDALRYVVASRPYTPDAEKEERFMTPVELANKEDDARAFSQSRSQPKTDMGAIFS